MQIKYLGGEKFEVRSSQTLVSLAYETAIDGFHLPGAGEYEKAGVAVVGIPNGQNTIYVVKIEGINLCYLGKIAQELRSEEIKEIGSVDILFLPLGEDGTLPTKKALQLLSKIDPHVVIPMLYSDLEEFKKSEGISCSEQEVLKIRKVDLPEEERQVIILRPVKNK